MKNKVAKVLLVGDSTMARLWAEARVFQSGEPSASKITETCGCDWLQDFGIKPSQVWGKPDHKEEGCWRNRQPGPTDHEGFQRDSQHRLIPEVRPLHRLPTKGTTGIGRIHGVYVDTRVPAPYRGEGPTNVQLHRREG